MGGWVCKKLAPVDCAVAQQEGALVQHGEDLRLETRKQPMLLVDSDHDVHVEEVTFCYILGKVLR
jgi:hypothetical protein